MNVKRILIPVTETLRPALTQREASGALIGSPLVTMASGTVRTYKTVLVSCKRVY